MADMVADTKPLNLIWRRKTLDYVLEGYFIKEILLGGLRRPVRLFAVEDGQDGPLIDDMLIVTLGNECAEYIRTAANHGCRNLGVFHMGDEHGDHDRGFYRHADYVLRNYFYANIVSGPDAGATEVLWVPNGYRNGVGPIEPGRTLPFADRGVPAFFAGALQERTLLGEREQMAAVIADANLPFTIVGTKGFGQGFGSAAYAGLMGNACFALVPGGNSPETIRLYDAMEHGAIPIMLESAFVSSPLALGAIGTPPLVLLDAWSRLPTVHANLTAFGVARLEEMRWELLDWWTRFKRDIQSRVSNVIEGSFSRQSPR